MISWDFGSRLVERLDMTYVSFGQRFGGVYDFFMSQILDISHIVSGVRVRVYPTQVVTKVEQGKEKGEGEYRGVVGSGYL